MTLFEYGRKQRAKVKPFENFSVKAPSDQHIVEALYNLRLGDEDLIERTTKFLLRNDVKERVITWLQDDEHPFLGPALASVPYLQPNEVVPRLIELARSPEPLIADGAVHALAVMGDLTAASCLLSSLSPDTPEERRFYAAAGLARLAPTLDPQVKGLLADALAQEDAWHIRDQLNLAISRLQRPN